MAKDDLIPQNKRTKDEQKQIARLGGIASGAARRERKSMREWAEVFGSLPVKVKTPDGGEMTTTTLGNIVAAQMAKATKGDTKAARFVADLMGEMEQNINVNGPLIVDKDELDALKKWSK